ncbi:MAG: type 4a pilus biogenesis protein PilO [Myxococcota bacterium]
MNRSELSTAWRSADLQIWTIGVSVVFAVLAMAFVYLGLRPTWQQYNQLHQSHERAQAVHLPDALNGTTEIETLSRRSLELRDALYGDAAEIPRSELESFVVRALDEISRRHGVKLRAITPAPPSPAWLFEELPYSVQVEGPYFAVHEWLYDVERDLRPMVVKQFEISPTRESQDVVMELRVVAYRASEGTSG